MKKKNSITWLIPEGFDQQKLIQAEALFAKMMKNRIFSLKFAYVGIPDRFYFFDNKGIDVLEAWDLQAKVNKLIEN